MSGSGRARVCVAVCTFRRPAGLAALLDALGALRFSGPRDPALELLVVDNAPEGGAQEVVDARAPAGWAVRYLHVGAGNISTARNAALDGSASADLVAMLDDDEVPAPWWLDELLRVQHDTQADAVIGPVRPLLPDDAPGWIRRGRFFDLAEPEDGAALTEGITGNALLRTAAVRDLGLRFEDALGVAGGEDQHLFRTAVRCGGQIRYAARADVREIVPLERCTFRYLSRRELRKGNTLGWLDAPRGDHGSVRTACLRLAKAAMWTGRGILQVVVGAAVLDRARAVGGALQVARATGMLGGLGGWRYQLYRSGDAGAGLVIVAEEHPDLQAAGHAAFLRGFVEHYAACGARVTVLVTGDRLGAVARRQRAGSVELRSPAVWRLPAGVVVARPRAALRQLAWQIFRRAPRRLQRGLDRVRNTWRDRHGVDHRLGEPLDERTASWVNDQLHELAPAGVLFWTVFGVPRPLRLPASVRSAHIVTVDVMWQRARAFAALGYRTSPAWFDRRAEAELLRAVPGLVAIQWDDAEELRSLAPDADVSVVPASIQVGATGAADTVPGRCLFVGSGALHNVDGLRWFLDRCWPAVRSRHADAELHVIGTVCARVGAVPPGVVLRGEVDALSDEYERATLAVVPLRAGSGLKVKLVEALVHGVAVVTTSVGAQGLLTVVPRPFALADDPIGFADAVVRMLDDDGLREQTVTRGRRVASRFAPGVAYAELDERLRAAGVLSRLPSPSTACDRPGAAGSRSRTG